MFHLAILAIAAVSPGDGKIVAQDDWQALSVLQVGGTPPGSSPYYLRVAAGDLDGDGLGDEAFLKLVCADGAVTQALMRNVKSPRDSASGMASGKRQHGTVTIVKEWGPSTPQFKTMKTGYNVKTMDRARVNAEGWWPVELTGSDGLCAAADAAAVIIVKSKSNITNN